MKPKKENSHRLLNISKEKIIGFFLFVWLLFAFSVYLYNYAYYFQLAIICAVFFTLLLPVILFLGLRKKFSLNQLFSYLQSLLPKKLVFVLFIYSGCSQYWLI